MAVLELLHGDCRAVMAGLPAASVDAIVCDPPYHLTSIVKRFGNPNSAPAQYGTDGVYARSSKGFMGKVWDGGDVAFQPEIWAAALRVAKPGAHLLAFGGTRTFHRLAVAIEDAGWEIRDTVMWVYGSGFPKSHDVGKGIDKAAGAEREVVGRASAAGAFSHNGPHSAFSHDAPARDNIDITVPATAAAQQWDGWGTALKPAWEPIIVARKPLEGTVAANVLAHGTGALNIDGCRIGTTETLGRAKGGWGNAAVGADDYGNFNSIGVTVEGGRWPANLIHDGSDEVVGLFPDSKGMATQKSGANLNVYGGNALNESSTTFPEVRLGFNDTGSAARFFYCAKANKNDRNEGLEEFEDRKKVFNGKTALASPSNDVEGSVNEKFSTHPQKNHHPTVKPTALMRYLCKLVTRAGGTVLDPFCGSGSTGKAAILEGFKFIGIEKDPEYHKIAEARIHLQSIAQASLPDTSHNELQVGVNTQSDMFK